MKASLDAFFASRDWRAISAATGWSIIRDADDSARVLFGVEARDGESYRALILCDGYPDVAPSVAFINESGSKADVHAWPRGDAAFFEEVKPPPSSFLCVPLTREGLAHHPDWSTSPTAQPWRADTHSLMDIFNHVHRLLNGDHYQGRAQ